MQPHVSVLKNLSNTCVRIKIYSVMKNVKVKLCHISDMTPPVFTVALIHDDSTAHVQCALIKTAGVRPQTS